MERDNEPDTLIQMSLEDSDRPGGFDRRSAIKYGGMAAGLVLATPTILTLGASPASASGRADTQFGNSSASFVTSVDLSNNGNFSTGLVVVTVAIAGDRTLLTPTSSTSNTWTLVPGSNMVGGTLLRMATYYSFMSASNSSGVNFNITWENSARCAAFATYFRTGSEVHSYVNGSPTSSTFITAPAGLVIPNSPANKPAILFCIAHNRTGTGPTYTNPEGFGQNIGIQTVYQATSPASGVAVNHSYNPPDFDDPEVEHLAATGSYSAVTGTLGSARTAGATMICIR